MQVVQAVDCTRIPFDSELVPIDPNPNRRRVTALNLEARRRVAQLLAGPPVVVADASVANLRELVREYLLYREVVVATLWKYLSKITTKDVLEFREEFGGKE
ncbi:hypothetical protein [Pseudomonas aeruginosa]|uniref:hypothetical protein n=1 Tax=Pseudomonas aeruginosa TaxID=287 RepID=UPI001068CE3E|nr:hypothetical protein [Pseudomonas aeruginosa]TED83605.1 hypothetical protein IPC1508_30745 [Pseudomonas aeruginosa]